MDKKLVPPAVQSLERLGAVYVVHEDAAVRAAIERDTERLEALLARGVPKLCKANVRIFSSSTAAGCQTAHLHRYKLVVDHNLFSETAERGGE